MKMVLYLENGAASQILTHLALQNQKIFDTPTG